MVYVGLAWPSAYSYVGHRNCQSQVFSAKHVLHAYMYIVRGLEDSDFLLKSSLIYIYVLVDMKTCLSSCDMCIWLIEVRTL